MKLKKKLFLSGFILLIAITGILIYSCSPKEDRAKPTLYTIDAELVSPQLLTAKETIRYTNNSEITLSKLSIHLYPNAFRADAVYKPYDKQETDIKDGEYGGITIKSTSINNKTTAHTIGGVDKNILYIPIQLDPTESVSITIAFELNIPKINHRFGRNDNTINFGNWYPIVCILENGEFREDPYYSFGDPFFSEIANYNISLTVPNDYEIATTGKATMTIQGGKKNYTMVVNQIRDFAFVASNQLETLTGQIEGININYHFYNDPNSAKNLELIQEVVATYNNQFGKYPYDTLSVVKTGFLHGGMEYPQIVYISDILEPETYQEVIVHEIAHQWWYAVVGNDQIKSAWIDEGLSEYSTTIFYELHPQYGITKQKRMAQVLSNFLLYCDLNGYLQGKNTIMEKPLSDFKSNMEYVFMVYAKGHLLFDSLRATIGDKQFFNGLKKYYNDNQFGLAQKENLIAAFESSSKIKLEKFFASWIDGKVQLLA